MLKIRLDKRSLSFLRESISKKELKYKKDIFLRISDDFKKLISNNGYVSCYISDKTIIYSDRISDYIHSYLEDCERRIGRLYNRIIRLHKYSGIEILEVNVSGEDDFDIILTGLRENTAIKIVKATVTHFTSIRILLKEEFIEIIQSAPNLFGFEIEGAYLPDSISIEDFIAALKKQLNSLPKQREFYINCLIAKKRVIVKISSGIIESSLLITLITMQPNHLLGIMNFPLKIYYPLKVKNYPFKMTITFSLQT